MCAFIVFPSHCEHDRTEGKRATIDKFIIYYCYFCFVYLFARAIRLSIEFFFFLFVFRFSLSRFNCFRSAARCVINIEKYFMLSNRCDRKRLPGAGSSMCVCALDFSLALDFEQFECVDWIAGPKRLIDAASVGI